MNFATSKTDIEPFSSVILRIPRDPHLEGHSDTATSNSSLIALTEATGIAPSVRDSLARFSLVFHRQHSSRPNAIKLPNNPVVFAGLLVGLTNISYPSHWISNFVHDVLKIALLVDHVAHNGELSQYISEFIKSVAAHRVPLDPWHAQFGVILTSSRYDSPFSLNLPDGFVTMYHLTNGPNTLSLSHAAS